MIKYKEARKYNIIHLKKKKRHTQLALYNVLTGKAIAHVLLSTLTTVRTVLLATMRLLDRIETRHMFKCFAEPKPRKMIRQLKI